MYSTNLNQEEAQIFRFFRTPRQMPTAVHEPANLGNAGIFSAKAQPRQDYASLMFQPMPNGWRTSRLLNITEFQAVIYLHVHLTARLFL
jgi:hypothetical protein